MELAGLYAIIVIFFFFFYLEKQGNKAAQAAARGFFFLFSKSVSLAFSTFFSNFFLFYIHQLYISASPSLLSLPLTYFGTFACSPLKVISLCCLHHGHYGVCDRSPDIGTHDYRNSRLYFKHCGVKPNRTRSLSQLSFLWNINGEAAFG